MSSNQDTLVYRTRHIFSGIFLSVLGFFVWSGAYALWKEGAIGLTWFMVLLGLFLIYFGISIFSQEEQIIFNFSEKKIFYYKHNRKQNVDNLIIPFNQIKHLLFLTGAEQGGGAGTVTHYGKIILNEEIETLPRKNEIEILRNINKNVVEKELHKLSELGEFEIFEQVMGIVQVPISKK